MLVKDNITFSGDTVVKTGNPDAMRIEVEKTIRAFDIGCQSGLFRVPRILDYDESKGRVVFERIHDIQGIRHLVSFGSRYGMLLEKSGIALAAIHGGLELPAEMKILLPDEFVHDGNEVFLHGDFSIDNVCVHNNNLEIVILDWQMTKVHGGVASYGTRYFDVVWFINNLFTKSFTKYMFAPSVRSGAFRFLTAYIESCDCSYDMRDFGYYMKEFYRIKMDLRRKSMTWKRRIVMTPGHMFWRMFIRFVLSETCTCRQFVQ